MQFTPEQKFKIQEALVAMWACFHPEKEMPIVAQRAYAAALADLGVDGIARCCGNCNAKMRMATKTSPVAGTIVRQHRRTGRKSMAASGSCCRATWWLSIDRVRRFENQQCDSKLWWLADVLREKGNVGQKRVLRSVQKYANGLQASPIGWDP